MANVVSGWFRRSEQRDQVSIREWFDSRIPHTLVSAFEGAFAWIDHVHRVSDPELMYRWRVFGPLGSHYCKLDRECVEVDEEFRRNWMGRYEPSRRIEAEEYSGPKMWINPRHPDRTSTIVHECWHLIEHEMLHTDRGMSALASTQKYRILVYIHQTASYKRCAAQTARVRAIVEILKRRKADSREIEETEAAAALFEYFMREDEWLARCYMQFIQNRVKGWGNNPFPFGSRTAEDLERVIPIYLNDSEASKLDRKMIRLLRMLP